MKNKSIKYILLSVAITSSLLFTACGHEHTFADATCTEPKTCTECNEIEGEALGHTWVDANCENPKTCDVCNLTEGNPLDHQWLEATTESPKTCELCALTDGDYQEPTAEEVALTSVPKEAIMEEYSEYSTATQQSISFITEMYEEGLFSEEDYKMAVDAIIAAEKAESRPSSS